MTCIMTSHTRAVVKLRRRAIENVRQIHTPPIKQSCNLWSIVAVLLFLHPLTATECSITWTVSNWDPWVPHIALHASWNVLQRLKRLESLQLHQHLALARVSVRDNLLRLNRFRRRHRTRCPAHIHAFLHDLAMVQPWCSHTVPVPCHILEIY